MHVLYIELSMRLLFREVAHARLKMGALHLCSTHLVITLFRQLPSHLGESMVLDKRIPWKVLFQHMGKEQ
jgi:hypothetical protein